MNIKKLENPDRLLELSPSDTLERIGLKNGNILCDIGAGTGIFSIAAAKITENTVYAVDINDELIALILKKAQDEKLDNLKTLKVSGNQYGIEAGTIDVVLLVTVFHELDDKDAIIEEIKRIGKRDSMVAIIEFHDKETPFGPPVSHRLGKDTVSTIFDGHGFIKTMDFDLGANFYCLLFKQK